MNDFQQFIAAVPQSWNQEPVIILSDTTWLELAAGEQKATTLRYKERIIYYVNKQAPGVISSLPFFYNAAIEDPPDITVRVLYPDGSVWSDHGSGADRYPVYTTEESATNKYVQKINIPKYIRGMVVSQTVERRYTRPEFFAVEMVAKVLPVMDRYIEFRMPDSAGIIYELFNEAQMPVVPADTTADGRKTVVYRAALLDKIDDPDSFNEAQRNVAAVYFSFPPEGVTSYSWEQLGDYYLSLIQGAYTGNDGLNSFAASIRETGCDSVVSQAALLIRKRMRYHNYSEGLHAFVPHSLSSIIDKGYGDCKDMSIVCQTIGRRHHCNIRLVMLNTADGFQPAASVPSLGVFDHVAVYYTSSDGERLVVDPTVRYGKPLESGFFHIGKKALFLDSANSTFDTIGEPSAYRNAVTTSSTLTFDNAAKAWKILGEITLSGMAAMNLYISEIPDRKKEQLQLLKKFCKLFFELDVTDASVTKMTPDTIVMEYSAPFQDNYVALSKGGFILSKPSLFGGHMRYTTLSHPGPRYFRDIVQRDTWNVPGGYQILEKENMETPIAQGTWLIRKRKISRQFKQKRVTCGSAEARETMAAKTAFSKATLWKK